jgi:hypothetical protein
LPLLVGGFCQGWLAERIDGAMSGYVLHSVTKERSTAAECAKKLRDLERRARAVLDWFGVRDGVSRAPPEALAVITRGQPRDERGQQQDWLSSTARFRNSARISGELTDTDAIRTAILGVQLIERQALLAARSFDAHKAKRRTPNEQDLHFFVTLTEVFKEAFGRRAGYSTTIPGTPGEGQRDSPAVRFARIVIQRVVERARLQMVDEYGPALGRLERIAQSPEAITERIRSARRGGKPRRR